MFNFFLSDRLNHQNSLENLRPALYNDSQYSANLPPLPYTQYEQQRATRLNFNERSSKTGRRCDWPVNGNTSVVDNRIVKEEFHGGSQDSDKTVRDYSRTKNDSLRGELRRAPNNNTDDSRRRGTRKQPSPRTSRNHLNVCWCSFVK